MTIWEDDIVTATETTLNELVVDEDTVEAIVKNIDIHKSPAIENVSARVLKDAFTVLVPPAYFYV